MIPAAVAPPQTPAGTIVNETDLPDALIQEAVQDYFIENSSMAWARSSTFQNYSGTGSMLTRREYRTPTNVIDEMKLARELAERDDDVAAAIDAMIAIAYADGMENFHEDEKTVGLFNGVARSANLDMALKEMYREYLITSSLVTASLFTRENVEWTPTKGDSREESMAVPLIGVLHAEDVRVIGDDTFGTATLAYDPPDAKLRQWLDTFFDPHTTPAMKAELGRTNRVAANMFIGIIEQTDNYWSEDDQPYNSGRLYLLNPRMVHRTTMPKGTWKYPRPLLTRNFALLEAKRLLNIMDFALLQGGSNFIVIVKKGTDERPALPGEVQQLTNVVRAASKTGVIVGDHRLSIEVITPDLKELLNPDKRKLIGRKLTQALMRTPEAGTEQAGSEGMKAETEMQSRVIASDRLDIKRHVERFIYSEVVKRNKRQLGSGAAKLWFPKIVLQGTQFFTDYVLKLRDRGDIPRKWAVEAAGFDYEAGVQQRKRELESGDDETLIPGTVPHSSPEAGPQDNNSGRPPGGRDDRPRTTINRNPGETIRAFYDETAEQIVRIGNVTEAILEEYPDYTTGRITAIEREALEDEQTISRGGVTAFAVNPGDEVENTKAVRLRDGLSMVTGQRVRDGALIAKVLVFREPEFSVADSETAVARWGFPVPEFPLDSDGNPETASAPISLAPNINVEIHSANGRTKRVITKDDQGNITGSIEVPVEEPEEQ